MIFYRKRFLLLFLCFLPSVCFGIGLDTKIAWEPWAINSAVMDFCMPQLEDGKTVKSNMIYDKDKLSSLGNVPMLIINWDKGMGISAESVRFIPKCADFIDAYIAKIQKDPQISLNQIISMCLDTIQDNLICENIVLVLVNLTENKKVLKNYDPKKMEQKIRESINANHTICSDDDKFCTTYTLFTERSNWASPDEVNGDAIYKNSDKEIVGVCAGINYEDAKGISMFHGDMRCVTTKNGYELYEFDIQDFTDKSIVLTYNDWGAYTDVVKKYLERINGMIQNLESCAAKKQGTAETARALRADYVALALDLCERDNSTQDAIAICKTQVLRAYHKKTTQNVRELTFDKAEKRLGIYKSMLESYFLDAKVLEHQTDVLLTDCGN